MRLTLLTLTVLASVAGSGCAGIGRYEPVLVPGQTARVEVVVGEDLDVPPDAVAPVPDQREKRLDVYVHDFANGCPAVKLAMHSKGFRGTIDASTRSFHSVDVPGQRRIAFTSLWGDGAGYAMMGTTGGALRMAQLFSVASFVPTPGEAYLVQFGKPNPRINPSTGVVVKKIVLGPTGVRSYVRLDDAAYPRELDGEPAFQPGGLCTLSP